MSWAKVNRQGETGNIREFRAPPLVDPGEGERLSLRMIIFGSSRRGPGIKIYADGAEGFAKRYSEEPGKFEVNVVGISVESILRVLDEILAALGVEIIHLDQEPLTLFRKIAKIANL